MKRLLLLSTLVLLPFHGAVANNATNEISNNDVSQAHSISALESAIASNQRTPAFAARDTARHPQETLSFFGVTPEMTVVEIWPGAGWYTEILAPYLKGKMGGFFYAAHFSDNTPIPYFKKSRNSFIEKLASKPNDFDRVEMIAFDPANNNFDIEDASADRVLTFRNVHNWLKLDSEDIAFELFYKALKPGGMLGVVEHRSRSPQDRQWMLESGYMTEEAVIALAEKAGFTLHAKSDINANTNDSANHPKGVWTLPPVLRLGDIDRDKYLAIGESDRMTLLFSKPLTSAKP